MTSLLNAILDRVVVNLNVMEEIQLIFDTVQFAVVLPVLVFGLWIALKRLHVTTRRITMVVSAAAGTTLTAFSLLDVRYVDTIFYSGYQRGFPLNWAVTYVGPPTTEFSGIALLLDVLFWMGLAYAALSLFSSVMIRLQSVREAGRTPGLSTFLSDS